MVSLCPTMPKIMMVVAAAAAAAAYLNSLIYIFWHIYNKLLPTS